MHSYIHIHTVFSYFLHYLLFRCLFFPPVPVQAVCVNGTLLCFVVGPLKVQLCLTRVRPLSIDIDRASLCVSESVPLNVSLFFSLFSPSLCLSPFLFSSFSHSFPHFLRLSFSPPVFSVFWSFFCQSAVLSWWVSVSSVDRLHTGRSQYNPLSILFTAHTVQYQKFIHLYPISPQSLCFTTIFGDNILWDICL